jgi:hypothetical protein
VAGANLLEYLEIPYNVTWQTTLIQFAIISQTCSLVRDKPTLSMEKLAYQATQVVLKLSLAIAIEYALNFRHRYNHVRAFNPTCSICCNPINACCECGTCSLESDKLVCDPCVREMIRREGDGENYNCPYCRARNTPTIRHLLHSAIDTAGKVSIIVCFANIFVLFLLVRA